MIGVAQISTGVSAATLFEIGGKVANPSNKESSTKEVSNQERDTTEASSLSLLKRNKIYGLSNSTTMQINAKESMERGSEEVLEKEENTAISGRYFAILIGVSDYQYNSESLRDLNEPTQDVVRLKTLLEDKYEFQSENLSTLLNPTRSELIDAMEALHNKIGKDDNLLIFYAGHGIWDKALNVGYWLPSDAKHNSKSNWISNSTLRDYIAGIDSKHTLLISDACFSGSIFKTREVGQSLNDVGFSRIYRLPSRGAMTSGTLNSVPDKSKFMEYLLKRLDNNQQQYLSAKQLFHQIETAVINNTSNIPQFGVIQNSGDEGGDFIFIKK